MASFEILLTSSARREFDALPLKLKQRVTARLAALGADPRGSGVVKLKGGWGYRVRVGEHRIIFDVADSEHQVHVTTIAPRKDAYRSR